MREHLYLTRILTRRISTIEYIYHGSPLSRTGVRGELSNGPSTRQTNLDTSDTESESEGGAPPSTLMLLPTAGQKRQRESEQAARQAESDAKAALAPAQAEEEEKEARAQVAKAEAAKLREKKRIALSRGQARKMSLTPIETVTHVCGACDRM